MTASGDFIRGMGGGSLLQSAAANYCREEKMWFSNWLAAGMLGNLCVSISEKALSVEMIINVFIISLLWDDRAVYGSLSSLHAASPTCRSQSPCLLSHYIDCGGITVSKFTMLAALTKGPAAAFWCPPARLIHRAGPGGAPFHISNVRWCYLRVTSNPESQSLFQWG